MARISDADIARVREATDLVAVVQDVAPLKPKGRDLWCCCPFHQEKTPSMKVDPSTQLWHCFGCGEGGDVFGFVMKSEDLSFPEAVRLLADRAHIDIVEEEGRGPHTTQNQKLRLKEVCRETAEFYHGQLMRNPAPEAADARNYLAGRGFKTPVAKRWMLGFAPGRGALVRHLTSKGFSGEEMTLANVALPGRDGRLRDRFFNRIMFPIFDASGDCIAFGGRVVGKGEPKYLNSQETPLFHKSKVLYGLDKAKASMAASGVAIVVEGYTDVIALHEAGIKNAVATLGTALTMRHIRLLSRHAQHRIVYLFDGDAAGQRAADRALGFIDESMTPEAGRSKVELAAVTLPDDLDPAEFVAARGADALRALIERAQPLLKYGIDRRLAASDLTTAEGRTRALTEALAVLAPIKDSLLAKDYAVQIAGRCRAREEDALAALAALEAPARRDEGPADGGAPAPRPAAPAPTRRLTQAERSRLRFEREFLSVLAQHPLLALAHADELAQVQWRRSAHGAIAASLLETLAADPGAAAGTLVTNATVAVPGAAGTLTAAAVPEGQDPAAVAAYLAEELSLGDAEEAIASMRALLSDPSQLAPEDYDALFQSVVGMQGDLNHRRQAHKPLPPA